MPCPSHPPWLDHSNYTWRRVQVMKLFGRYAVWISIRTPTALTNTCHDFSSIHPVKFLDSSSGYSITTYFRFFRGHYPLLSHHSVTYIVADSGIK
jgi:hypothetical protein